MFTSENMKNDFEVLLNELKSYSPKLVQKKMLVSLSKADLIDPQKVSEAAQNKFKGIKDKPIIFSSITGFGLNEMLDIIWDNLQKEKL